MFHNGKLYPFNFKRYPCTVPPSDFVEAYGRILEENGLTDLLGFQVYTNGVIGLEDTDVEAKASTTVDSSETAPVLKEMAPASWPFFWYVGISIHDSSLLISI